MVDRLRPSELPSLEQWRAMRAQELARARAAAPPGKEPFDPRALEPFVSFKSAHSLGLPSEEEVAAYTGRLEYEYYVLWPNVMSMREFGELLENAELYGH